VHWAAGYALLVLGIIGNIIYISLEGLPTGLALAAGSKTDTVEGTVFVTGLLAGCVTFGGAFTAVPCVPIKQLLRCCIAHDSSCHAQVCLQVAGDQLKAHHGAAVPGRHRRRQLRAHAAGHVRHMVRPPACS
jgi:hypothetical protein